ncbi:MAG: hypothetical protein QXS93_02275 [Candidatus Micrarchaeia archaeon]
MKSYNLKRTISAVLVAGQLLIAPPVYSNSIRNDTSPIWKEIKRMKDNDKGGDIMVAQKTEVSREDARKNVSEELSKIIDKAYTTGYKGLEEDRKYMDKKRVYGDKKITREEWLKIEGVKYLTEEQKEYLKNNEDNYLGKRLLYVYAVLQKDIREGVATPDNFLKDAKSLVKNASERIPKQMKEAVPQRVTPKKAVGELPEFEYGHIPSPPSPRQIPAEELEKTLAKRREQGKKDAEKILELLKGERENKPYTYYIGEYWVQYLDGKCDQVMIVISKLSGKERDAYIQGFLKELGFKGEYNELNFNQEIGKIKGLATSVKAIRAEIIGYSESLKGISEVSAYTQSLALRETAIREKLDGLEKYGSYGKSIKERLMKGYSFEGEKGNYLTNITEIAKDKEFLARKQRLYDSFSSWYSTDKNLKSQYKDLDGSIVWSTFNALDLRTQKEILEINEKVKPGNEKLAALILGARSMPDNYAPLFISQYAERILRNFDAVDIPKIMIYTGSYMNLFNNARDLDGLNRYVSELDTKLSAILMWNIYRVWERTRETPKTAKIGQPGGKEYFDLFNPAAQIAINRYLTLFENQDLTAAIEKLNAAEGSTFDERASLVIRQYPNLFAGPLALMQNFEQAYMKTMGPIVQLNITEPEMDISVINFDLDLYALAPTNVPKLGELDVGMLGLEGSGNSYSTFAGPDKSALEQYKISGRGGAYGPGMKAEATEITYEKGTVSNKVGLGKEGPEITENISDRFTADLNVGNIPGGGVFKDGRLYYNVTRQETTQQQIMSKGVKETQTQRVSADKFAELSFEHLAPGGAVTAVVFDYESIEKGGDIEHRGMNAEVFRKQDGVWVYAGTFEITPREAQQMYGVWHQQWDKAKNFSTRQEGAAVLFFDKDLFGEKEKMFQGVGVAMEYGKAGAGVRYEHKQAGPDKGAGVMSYQPNKNKIWAGILYINPEFANNYNGEILFKEPAPATQTTTGEPITRKESIGARPQLTKEKLIGEKAEKGAAVELMFAESNEYYSDAFVSATSETLRLGAMSRAVRPWGYFGIGGTGIVAAYGEREDIRPGGVGRTYYAASDKAFMITASVAAQAYEKYTGVTQAAGMRYFFEQWGGINNVKVVEVYQKGADEKNGVFGGAEIKRDKLGRITQVRLYYINGKEWEKAQKDLSLNLFGGGAKFGKLQLEIAGATTGPGTGVLVGGGGSAKVWLWKLTDNELKISPAIQITSMGDLQAIGATSLIEYGGLRLQLVPISYYQQVDKKGSTKSKTYESSAIGRYYLLGGFLDAGAGWLTQIAEEEAKTRWGGTIGKGEKAHELALIIGGGETLSRGYFDEWSVHGGYVYWLTPYEEKHRLNLDVNLTRWTAPGLTLNAYINLDKNSLLFYKDPKTGYESVVFNTGLNIILIW